MGVKEKQKNLGCALMWGVLLGAVIVGTFGKTYPIAEEDILQKVKQAHVRIDFQKALERLYEYRYPLPYAKELKVEEEVPVWTAPRTITYEGKVLVKAGQKVYPLRSVSLRSVYVFATEKQIEAFIKEGFHERYPTTFLLTEGNVRRLKEKYPNVRLFLALPQVVKALKVKRVPTVVYQSGEKLVKVEVPWSEGKLSLPF